MTKTLNNIIDDMRDQLWIIKDLAYQGKVAELEKEYGELGRMGIVLMEQYHTYVQKKKGKKK